MPLRDAIASFDASPLALVKTIGWWVGASISTQPHIFVVGAPRSGTTLLKAILSVHPEIGGLDRETGFFMYRNIFNLTHPELQSEDIDSIRRRSKDIVEFYDKFALLVLAKTKGSRCIEKTPQHVLRLKFLTSHFPNARFINIFRDGRDCFVSATRNRGVPQNSSVKSYALYWKRCVSARHAVGAHSNVLDVSYEELTNAPENVIRQVMGWLGEPFMPCQLDPKKYSQNQVSNRPEFTKLKGAIDNSSSGQWHSTLTNRQKAEFLQIAGAELKMLGYL